MEIECGLTCGAPALSVQVPCVCVWRAGGIFASEGRKERVQRVGAERGLCRETRGVLVARVELGAAGSPQRTRRHTGDSALASAGPLGPDRL